MNFKLTGSDVMNYRKTNKFSMNYKLTKADIQTAFFYALLAVIAIIF